MLTVPVGHSKIVQEMQSMLEVKLIMEGSQRKGNVTSGAACLIAARRKCHQQGRQQLLISGEWGTKHAVTCLISLLYSPEFLLRLTPPVALAWLFISGLNLCFPFHVHIRYKLEHFLLSFPQLCQTKYMEQQAGVRFNKKKMHINKNWALVMSQEDRSFLHEINL